MDNNIDFSAAAFESAFYLDLTIGRKQVFLLSQKRKTAKRAPSTLFCKFKLFSISKINTGGNIMSVE